MSITRLSVSTAMAMIAFAGNSLLCRIALTTTPIDAISFTGVRIVAGAITLFLLSEIRRRRRAASAPCREAKILGGNWLSALALFGYAAGFSLAYLSLSAATGALLLFGAVQSTMIGCGLARGERMRPVQVVGVLLAIGGLIALLLPGLSSPPLPSALLMLGAGMCWGVYSLRGARYNLALTDATRETAGNFIRATPLALLLSLAALAHAKLDGIGIALAVASGALASGLGYALWYSVLPALSATTAATLQLTVPALTAAGGILFLAEPITLRLSAASVAILGGVAIYIASKRNGRAGKPSPATRAS